MKNKMREIIDEFVALSMDDDGAHFENLKRSLEKANLWKEFLQDVV